MNIMNTGREVLKIFLILSLTVFSYGNSTAQVDRHIDKVVLTNGSVIWGVSESGPDNLKVWMNQQDSLIIPMATVKSLKTGKLNPELYVNRLQGVYYQFSSGVLVGKYSEYSDNEVNFSASFVSGYKFKPSLGVGLGVGFNLYSDQYHIPLFVDIQGDVLKNRVTPYYQLSLGYSWGYERDNNPSIENIEGGVYFSPAAGVRWHMARHSWHFKVSYVHQESVTHYEPIDFGNGNMITNVEDRSIRRLGVSVGISF